MAPRQAQGERWFYEPFAVMLSLSRHRTLTGMAAILTGAPNLEKKTMLKSKFAMLTLGILLGVVAGAGGMLIVHPFVFSPPVVNEAAPKTADAATSAMITFNLDENAPGRDPVHWANGSGSVIRTAQGEVLRLNGDFEAGPGPNFWVYLNTRAVGEEKDFNADAGRVKIAPLKSFIGAQNFMLPEGLDITKFHTVTIWCESFGAYIASGMLNKP